jgi:hypothetical protein
MRLWGAINYKINKRSILDINLIISKVIKSIFKSQGIVFNETG